MGFYCYDCEAQSNSDSLPVKEDGEPWRCPECEGTRITVFARGI